ncbi:MAG TPA: putative metallopeptidase [Vicinamibacterales bacterium]|nr:putative metallopeptidase [Vicinamibacterales bacterium]
MAKKREKKPKPQRLKKVTVTVLERAEHERMYELLDALIEEHHDDLREAKIKLAWNTSWQPDVDGRVVLGKCILRRDLDRELADVDAVIAIHEKFWTHDTTTPQMRRALLDHELCHLMPRLDGAGEQMQDERGRKVWRMRKHDIEEFSEIVERHGCYKRDLEQFQQAMDRARARTSGDAWIGYSRLQEQLRAAGAGIPLDVITTWTEDQRREAMTWAIVRAEHVGQVFETKPPAFVLEAIPGGTLTQSVAVTPAPAETVPF